jgi:Flp pilus assembly protein TadD
MGPPSEQTLDFYNNYGNALRRAGHYEDAEKVLAELVSVAPHAWQPWHNLGQTLLERERPGDAAAALRRAIMLEPGFGPNHGVLGEALLRLGRLRSAHAALTRCVQLGWDSDPGLWAALGATEQRLGRLERARQAFERALALSPRDPEAHSNLAIVLGNLGRFEEAIDRLDAALELEPESDRLHGHRAHVLLAAGRLSEGWDEWERAWVPGLRGNARPLGVPRWTRGDLDSRVLVYPEQGVGDELMFASCYPDLIEAASEVVIECDPRLRPLFARSFTGAQVRATSVGSSRPDGANDYKRVIAAGSLPTIFRRTIRDFPRRLAFLSADHERIEEWRQQLESIGSAATVGIAWRSGDMSAERRLEYTSLSEWNVLFSIPNVTWVNLQYDGCEAELGHAERRFGVRILRWSSLDLKNNLDGTAALMSALDLVISPRTAVAMLSGALGIETLTLANRHAWPDLGAGGLPWFPSIRMIYREPEGDWQQALAAAARVLADIVSGPRPGPGGDR